MKNWIVILSIALLGAACASDENTIPSEVNLASALLQVPEGFPEVDFPEDNAFTMARWELGRKLFYDPILSIDASISCGSCHNQSNSFSDVVAFSPGAENAPGTRNAPSLANVAYHPYFTREGGVPTLEMHVLVPIQEHNEFNHNIVAISEQLMMDEAYVEASQKAYERNPDPFVITRALATFQRTLLSGNSDYDKYLNGTDPTALSPEAKRGMELFFSNQTNCSSCHGGFNFTEYAFENNGLYETYQDNGKFRLTGIESDRAKFKVASLRNIELTAPYMHDGSMSTLEEVIEHYNSGGQPHPNKSELIQPLNLNEEEKAELLAFLRSLTDYDFITREAFSNPN
jgi:cytochrome c peroxidase